MGFGGAPGQRELNCRQGDQYRSKAANISDLRWMEDARLASAWLLCSSHECLGLFARGPGWPVENEAIEPMMFSSVVEK